MRAVGLVCDQKPAVKRSAGAHSARQFRRGLYHVSSAQAIAMRPNLLFPVHLRLRIQKGNISDRISFCRAGREERSRDFAVLLSVSRFVKVERLVEYRSPGHPVEMIRYQH